MHYRNVEQGYLIRLSRDEELITSLTTFLKKKNITSGIISGIGAVSEIELGFYNLDEKSYIWRKYTDPMEIASIQGNIALNENQPFVHLHGVFTGRKFNAVGGHIRRATIGATCEININIIDQEISRKLDEEIGLKLLEL